MNTPFWSDGMIWYVLLYACAALVTSRAPADGRCIRMQKILELVHGYFFLLVGIFVDGTKPEVGGLNSGGAVGRGRGAGSGSLVPGLCTCWKSLKSLNSSKNWPRFSMVEGAGSASMLCNRWPMTAALKWRWLGVWYILLIHAGDTKVDGTAYMTVPLLVMAWRTCPTCEVERLVCWLPKERNLWPCSRATECGVVWGVS